MAKTLAKGARITGTQRESLAKSFAKRYASGDSIRRIAEDSGRSFGFVHGVLTESATPLRGRGGATRGVKKTAAKAPPATKKSAAKKSAVKKSAAKKSAAKRSGATEPSAKASAKNSSTKTAAKKSAKKR